MKILAGAATDVGRVRDTNEDAFLVDADLGLFAVADGMGGANAGEVASHLALSTMHAQVAASTSDSLEDTLRQAIEAANTAVMAEAAADRAKSEMGTTITAMLIRGDRAVVGHVGDSRLYRVRWGRVEQLTEDHTAVAELVKVGAVKEEDAHSHPWAHCLLRVIGREGVEVQLTDIDIASGDRLLLCSDGFSNSVGDPSWLTLLDAKPPTEFAADLVARAVSLDGKDNATAVVVAIGTEHAREARQSLWKRFRKNVAAALHRGDAADD